MTLHSVLNDTEKATRHLAEYYRPGYRFGLPRTGANFDQWAGGGDSPDVKNRFTADDLVAVSFLSVNVPAVAAISFIRDDAALVEKLLSAIPADLRMAELDDDGYREHLGMESPAQKLWETVTRRGKEKWGIGPTTASKLLARKRPHLIPIVDSLIFNIVPPKSYWGGWHRALTDGTGLVERLEGIKADSGIVEQGFDPSVLRIMDIVLWREAYEIKAVRQVVSQAH
ncbi:DUF6308 family protein [Arthrobacter sp. CAN_C5]|uniref:DUF6308 family protein n=1 Tax=Arthrobacter sp. CAN_C5 TaxID=2760706 RepID=UPI001AE64E35|nr:DUF6308 family protein [Arthrobacter sp. CAN_C5]MBP2216069.1 hypothetical protein [Arthrobacter sp. CAN_C5]